jgi:drug/metabolite transporter (DMT)-like permease
MGVIWGIPYLLIKVAVADVSTPVLVFARTAGATVILLPLAIRSGKLGLVRKHWKPTAVFAVTEIIGPWFLLSDAERHLSSSMSGLLVAAVPVIGVLMVRFTGNAERLSPVRWLGLALGLGGVAVLAAPNLHGGDARSVIEVMLVAIGYAGSPLLAERRLKEVPTLPLTAVCLTLAAVVYAPAAALTLPQQMPSGKALAALAGLAIICTALAFIVFFELIAEIGASRAMVITYVNPAVAVAAGVLILGEPLTLTIGVSFVMILAGSVLATAQRRKAASVLPVEAVIPPGDDLLPAAPS